MLLPDHLHPILGSAVDTWATVFVAVGTVGAVAYALFRDLFVVPRRRPRLDLRFDATGNDQVVVGTAGGLDAACVRLRVANGAGKDTPDDVVVMVTEVRQLEDSEKRLAEAQNGAAADLVRVEPASDGGVRASRLRAPHRPLAPRLARPR